MLGQWTDPKRVAEYLSREIPHRDIAEELLLEALPQRVGRVLDLGTGNGRLLALVCSHVPRPYGGCRHRLLLLYGAPDGMN